MTVQVEIKDEDLRHVVEKVLEMPAYEPEQVTEQQVSPMLWIPASEPPKDNQKVVVRTKDGCVYFETPRDGKLMKNVAYWYPLPADDAIKTKGDQDGKES